MRDCAHAMRSGELLRPLIGFDCSAVFMKAHRGGYWTGDDVREAECLFVELLEMMYEHMHVRSGEEYEEVMVRGANDEALHRAMQFAFGWSYWRVMLGAMRRVRTRESLRYFRVLWDTEALVMRDADDYDFRLPELDELLRMHARLGALDECVEFLESKYSRQVERALKEGRDVYLYEEEAHYSDLEAWLHRHLCFGLMTIFSGMDIYDGVLMVTPPFILEFLQVFDRFDNHQIMMSESNVRAHLD